jgi:hypothetical protein
MGTGKEEQEMCSTCNPHPNWKKRWMLKIEENMPNINIKYLNNF